MWLPIDVLFLAAVENDQYFRLFGSVTNRLSLEWQAYISRTHKLRKAFISVKGIYYQAEVDGQKVTWLTPHALQQVMPQDVDYKIMYTFLVFYETLLGFASFKL
ncbi:pescadillo [Tanacetum coccineum]